MDNDHFFEREVELVPHNGVTMYPTLEQIYQAFKERMNRESGTVDSEDEVTLILSKKDAHYLKLLVQNPMFAEEPFDEGVSRKNIFDALPEFKELIS